ncbi:hypothetical protein B0J14DRAFT_659313 [Halenospora varia]|nr:hypothetical protein B0J14DRAFT_659313 [Halenospora varia]
MTSLNPTEVSAIVALLDLRNSDHIVDLNVLSDVPSDSIDNLNNFNTQTMDTDFFFLDDNSKEKDHSLGKTTTMDIAPEGGSLPLYYFAGAETNVSMEDCGSSSTESECWAEYLADCSEESLSPNQMHGFLYGGDDDISRMDYAEVSNSLWEDWTMNSMLEYDLEKAQSNTWIDEPLLDAILSEAHVASSESGMDLLEWSIINDTLLGDKPKKRQKVCRKNSSKSVKTRHQPARVGITKVLHHNKRDCLPQKLVKLKVGQKFVDLVNEWSQGNMKGNF